MGINIQAKTNYSALFSTLNANNNNGISNLSSLLSDYSSIKSGTYGKLLKSYYGSENGKVSSANKDSKDKNDRLEKLELGATKADENTKAYNKVSASADSLQKSVDAIAKLKDDASDDDVYNAVNNYVKSYNSFVNDSSKVDNKTISGRVDTIEGNTASNIKSLSKFGITKDADGKLAVDKDTLAGADKDALKSLFGRGSYGYSVSVSAGMAASNANYEATKTSLYTNNGSYNMQTGTMMDSLF